ncbi:folate-Biopterin Transporter (FBT) family [Thraustotheca clavata]|uniref:Folate-Biopterin Transporter (FBT) family n=1 Tax=Thraustotheca clavata TaxID=74557 RepID=A0A1V9ZZ82_9STRA|nr:folate-Biopterin Transporter (FBT) family [Thraustotheca clavata]
MRQSQKKGSNTSKNEGIWLYDEATYAADMAMTFAEIDEEDYPRKTTTSEKFDMDGALRPGGAIDLTSREAIGLLGQYVAVGMVYGFLPALQYPVFTQYLNFDGYEVASYSTLVTISWSLKIFVGIITDCFPLFGLKRKPYMIIGWLICIVALSAMTFNPFPKPYLSRELAQQLSPNATDMVRGGDFSKLTTSQVAMVNQDAKSNSLYYILLSALASLGYVIADVAADAMVVQYAQREALAVRGQLQSAVYGTRFAASLLPQVLTGFCLNGPEFGGSFDWSLSINLLYGVMLLPCGFAIWCTIFLIKEERELQPVFSNYMGSLWKLLQLRVTYQICAFRFLSNLCFDFDATVSNIMPMIWAHVQPLTSSWFDILNTVLISVCIFCVGRWGLNMNWRYTIALATIGIVVIDATIVFLTTWNVVRNQYFFMGGMTPDALPNAVRFVISAYCAVEIADIGNEGAIISLITTIVNLADPVSTVIYKYIDSFFDTSTEELAKDTEEVRWQVTYVLLIAFGMQLLSLVFLPLLPQQKVAIQWLKRRGGSSKCAAVVIVLVYFITLTFSVATNIMSLYPSTSCYRIAGGDGQPVLSHSEAIGLLGQYVAVGMILGFIPSLGYPVFTQYLNFNGYESASYSILVTISWSLKFFVGIFTDCFSLFGLKRKPYMIAGWFVCIVALAVITFTPFPQPYISRELAQQLSPNVTDMIRGGDFSRHKKQW